MDLFTIIAFVVTFYMMFSVAGDNYASVMGGVVGSGVRTNREAIIILAIFGTIGAILEGSGVSQTLGGGIIEQSIPNYAAIAIVLTTAIWGSGLLLGFVPVASAYAIVGATIGVGLFLGSTLNMQQLEIIVVGWLSTPFIAFGLAVVISWFIVPLLRLKLRNSVKRYRVFSLLLTASACFQAYTFGANRIGFATGPFRNTFGVDPTALFFVALSGMIIGPLVIGKKFVKVIGRQITALDEGQAFSMNTSSVSTAYVLNLFGLPASFDVAVFGSVIGAGASKGISRLRMKIIKKLVYVWLFTITMSVLSGYTLALVFKTLGGS
jgi:phosphate/sulfate permease